MKSFEELTRDELLELSDDDIEAYINWACAEAGAPLLPPIPVEPIALAVVPDVSAWEISGDLIFTDHGEAQAALALLSDVKSRHRSEYISARSYDYKKTLCVPDTDLELKQEKYWSAEHYEAHRAELESYQKQKAAYDKYKKEYDEAINRRRDEAQHIYDAVGRAKDDNAEECRMKSVFGEYLTLAENDLDTAGRFLFKAYPHWDTNDVRTILELPLHPVDAQSRITEKD